MTLSVSVILPTHDRPEGAAAVVRALLDQTRRPDEIIVIDDGSHAPPGRLAHQASQKNVRYVYERRSPPSLPASRNRGMELATGDVVLFTEDDLVTPPDYIERLSALYEADPDGKVAAIGGVVDEAGQDRPGRRVWDGIMAALGQNRWGARVCACRYVRLPTALRGRLVPSRWISGGAISLRRRVAEVERFEETFGGYAYAEDIEFCYRIGRRHALFLAPELRVFHDRAEIGRPGAASRGRMYARNLLHIARHSTAGGVGTIVLLGTFLAGAIGMHLVWSALTRRGEHAAFASGLLRGLVAAGLRAMRARL